MNGGTKWRLILCALWTEREREREKDDEQEDTHNFGVSFCEHFFYERKANSLFATKRCTHSVISNDVQLNENCACLCVCVCV